VSPERVGISEEKSRTKVGSQREKIPSERKKLPNCDGKCHFSEGKLKKIEFHAFFFGQMARLV
jgi:hypothetical protein